MMMMTIVKAKLPGQMFCSSGGGRPAGFMASRYHHHHPYDYGGGDCDDDGDGGCLPCWIHTLPKLSLVSNVFSAVSSIFWNSKLHLFQTFSRLLLEKQPAAGAPASAPISCIGRISGCTAGHSASCISVAFHTFELHQELASGWLALHWPNSSHLPLPGQLPSHLRNRI